jgi:two-component system response regulator HydG
MDRMRILLEQENRRYPIIGVAAGSGQVTLYAVEAGADLIMALNAGVYRNLGAGSLAAFMPYGNANEQTFKLIEHEILPRSHDVPIMAGILAGDPTCKLSLILKRLKKVGVAAVVNWPAVGFIDGRFRKLIELEGLGVDLEARMLVEAKKMGFASFGFALEEEAIHKFIRAGVDGLILDIGLTRKVDDIFQKRDLLEQSIASTNKMLAIVKKADRKPLCLAFGGVITTREDLELLFRHTDIDGFAGGSVFERFPVYNAITSMVYNLKSIQLRPPDYELAYERTKMVGKSLIMEELFKFIAKIAPYDVNVYIEGESGTGKELVATQIHRLSTRSEQPFVAVNCGAIPDSLLEGELFGHEKGAFTNADHRRLGKLELANNGTLFLDEIGDLSKKGQVALLRVIEQREVTRVGGNESIPINVRLVAASNRNLSKLVKEGRFREDLYYRINNIILYAPPLRDHRDDITLLVDFFISRLRIQLNRPEIQVSATFYKKLYEHNWPGNVRELEHVLCKAALLEDSPVLEGGYFIPNVQNGNMPTPYQHTLFRAESQESRESILRHAMENANGNKSRAAKALGISRKTLYNWLNHT